MEQTVLTVDDCNTTRKIITYMVKGAGFKPIGAIHGLEDKVDSLTEMPGEILNMV